MVVTRDSVCKYLHGKNWSSLTGLVGDVERRFGDKITVVDFDGWTVVLCGSDNKAFAVRLNSQEPKGSQLTVWVTASKRKNMTTRSFFDNKVEIYG